MHFFLLAVSILVFPSLRITFLLREGMMMGDEKIDQMCSLNYLDSIISDNVGYREDVKIRIANALGVFSPRKKFGRIQR